MRVPFARRAPTRLKKVLVVDDEPHIVRYVSAALKPTGYAVVSTTQHEEVLEKALTEGVHLILLGVPLRPLDIPGCEIAQAVRSAPTLANVPIIVMTGKTSSSQDLPWCADLPATGCITKPFHPIELLALINRLFPELAAE